MEKHQKSIRRHKYQTNTKDCFLSMTKVDFQRLSVILLKSLQALSDESLWMLSQFKIINQTLLSVTRLFLLVVHDSHAWRFVKQR